MEKCNICDKEPRNNGAVLLTTAQITKAVMSSAAEAELGALYINSRKAVPMRHLLNEMGHPQPPTPIQTDNSTALGVVKIAQSSQNEPWPWTCISTPTNNNFELTGRQAQPTMETT